MRHLHSMLKIFSVSALAVTEWYTRERESEIHKRFYEDLKESKNKQFLL